MFLKENDIKLDVDGNTVTLTHIPTGIVTTSSNGKNLKANRKICFKLLEARFNHITKCLNKLNEDTEEHLVLKINSLVNDFYSKLYDEDNMPNDLLDLAVEIIGYQRDLIEHYGKVK